MIEAEEPAEAFPAYDRSRPVEVGGRHDKLAVQALMVSLFVVVSQVLADRGWPGAHGWGLRRLIDMALRRGGSYYFTYHRAARLDQVEGCYPQFERFLAHKRPHDPNGLFQSEWFRHDSEMFNQASEH